MASVLSLLDQLVDTANAAAEKKGHKLAIFNGDGTKPMILHTHCDQCGYRVRCCEADDPLVSGDALLYECDGNRQRLSESRAWLITCQPEVLEDRLLVALDHSDPHGAPRFSYWIFDQENQRLLSEDGMLAMQYRIRSRPDEPISDDNLQKDDGVVESLVLVPCSVPLAGTYDGPTIEVPPDIFFMPLEAQDIGFVYPDYAGHWRFKRSADTFGYYVDPADVLLEDGSRLPGVPALSYGVETPPVLIRWDMTVQQIQKLRESDHDNLDLKEDLVIALLRRYLWGARDLPNGEEIDLRRVRGLVTTLPWSSRRK